MEWPWRVKLRQAEWHLRRLREETERFVTEAHVGFHHEFDDGTITVRLHADREPPMLLGAIVGDVLHNLRSSLDAIAWEVATRAGDPPDDGKRVYFPITLAKAKWPKAAAGKLPNVSPEHVAKFEVVQPWYWDEQAREAGVEVASLLAERHPLALLDDMAKHDRHRTTQPVVARGDNTWLGLPEGVTATASDLRRDPRPGDVVIRWHVTPPERAHEVHPDGRVTLTFDGVEERTRQPSTDVLEGMVSAVREALRLVEIEVLEVVTKAEMAELSALWKAASEAEGALHRRYASDETITMASYKEYERLRAEHELAKSRWVARSQELFD